MAYDFTAESAHRVGGRWPVSRAQGFVSPAVQPRQTQALTVDPGFYSGQSEFLMTSTKSPRTNPGT